jgi:hypothetical protein
MVTIAELENLAFSLPENERAVLASHLLRSLPPVLEEQDDDVAEALRRDAELDAHPHLALTLDQLDQHVADRRA